MEKIKLTQLGSVAERVLNRLPDKKESAVLIALSGELGAGKTTFVQALGRALGVKEPMQSPTYVLMKSYPINYPSNSLGAGKHFTRLIHIDAYRLASAKEFAALKPELFLKDPANIVCIEWPERVEGALPTPDITLNFSSDLPQGVAGGASEEERYITFY